MGLSVGCSAQSTCSNDFVWFSPQPQKEKLVCFSSTDQRNTGGSDTHLLCTQSLHVTQQTVYPWTFKLESNMFCETISHWKWEPCKFFVCIKQQKKSCRRTCLISFATVHILHVHIVMLMLKLYTVQPYMVQARGRPIIGADILHF